MLLSLDGPMTGTLTCYDMLMTCTREQMEKGPFEFRIKTEENPHLKELLESNWDMRWSNSVPLYSALYAVTMTSLSLLHSLLYTAVSGSQEKSTAVTVVKESTENSSIGTRVVCVRHFEATLSLECKVLRTVTVHHCSCH